MQTITCGMLVAACLDAAELTLVRVFFVPSCAPVPRLRAVLSRGRLIIRSEILLDVRGLRRVVSDDAERLGRLIARG